MNQTTRKHKHFDIIKRLTDHGLTLVSTPLQLKRNSLIFTDTLEPNVKYGIYESGYVRKAIPSMYSGDAWYQLNKTKKKASPMFSEYYETIRILETEYWDMCAIILRVSMKSRYKFNNKKS